MKRHVSFSLVVIVVLALSPSAWATLFDLEEFTGNTSSSSKDLTSLSSTKDGITMTITRSGGAGFTIFDSSSSGLPFPASWGTKHLSPFGNVIEDSFIVNFSTALSSIAVDYGDFGGDAEDVYVEVYSGLSGTGTWLGSTMTHWLDTTNLVSFTGRSSFWSSSNTYQSLILYSRGDYPQSFYWDNFDVTAAPVPEPSTMVLLGSGLVGLVGYGRRRLKE